MGAYLDGAPPKKEMRFSAREKGKGRTVIGENKVRGDNVKDGMEPVEKQEAFKTEGSSEVCNICQF